jgi:hypothetical protein
VRRPFGTYWAAEWRSVNRLDGDTRHLIHDTDHRECHAQHFPLLFHTRREARAFIEEKFGYIRERPDLRSEPHGWRVPQPVLVQVLPTSAIEEAVDAERKRIRQSVRISLSSMPIFAHVDSYGLGQVLKGNDWPDYR